jgi:hypothetical protein
MNEIRDQLRHLVEDVVAIYVKLDMPHPQRRKLRGDE